MANHTGKIDFKSIQKLPPDKRIEALREIQEEIRKLIEEKKREIEEAEDLLEKAEEELSVLLEIETPKVRQIKVEELFAAAEEEKPETPARKRRGGRGLERIAEEAPGLRLSQEQQQYANRLSQMPAQQLYSRIAEFYRESRDVISRTGIETADMRGRREALFAAVEKKKEVYEEMAVKGAAAAWEGLTRAEQMLKAIQYGRKLEAPPQEFYKR